jgi:hypothetical protein
MVRCPDQSVPRRQQRAPQPPSVACELVVRARHPSSLSSSYLLLTSGACGSLLADVPEVQHSSPVPPFLPQDGARGRGTRGERRYRCSVEALSVALSCSDLEHRAGFQVCGAELQSAHMSFRSLCRCALRLALQR